MQPSPCTFPSLGWFQNERLMMIYILVRVLEMGIETPAQTM